MNNTLYQVPISKRKPISKLPLSLKRFQKLFDRISNQIPMGPTMLGKTFVMNRLSKKDIEWIKSMRYQMTVREITEQLAKEGLFVREETVVAHLGREAGLKFWKKNQSSRKDARRLKKDLKPFIEWLLASAYSYSQIAECLMMTPPTVRIWINQYGYVTHHIVRKRTPDLTGKQLRLFPEIDDSDRSADQPTTTTPEESPHERVESYLKGNDVVIPTAPEKTESRIVIANPDACGLEKDEIERFQKKTTWQSICKRLQNPNHKFRIMDCSGNNIKYLSLIDVDPYNGLVSLRLEGIVPIAGLGIVN